MLTRTLENDSDEGDFSKWRSLTGSVRQGQFIPILDADMGEHVFGSSREIASRLGELHGFPLATRACPGSSSCSLGAPTSRRLRTRQSPDISC